MEKAYHFYFKGMVQGVGFRYTVKMAAFRYGLSGWVRNLSDGRVEAFIQGDKTDVLELLDDLKSRFGGYIREYTMNETPAVAALDDFEIRF
ncbi:MAG: acylphosphatase [Candidatus Omnitrophica bacterium]|nr:acylphosphatase [Candidatus Omnitrophota bacterium]